MGALRVCPMLALSRSWPKLRGWSLRFGASGAIFGEECVEIDLATVSGEAAEVIDTFAIGDHFRF